MDNYTKLLLGLEPQMPAIEIQVYKCEIYNRSPDMAFDSGLEGVDFMGQIVRNNINIQKQLRLKRGRYHRRISSLRIHYKSQSKTDQFTDIVGFGPLYLLFGLFYFVVNMLAMNRFALSRLDF